MLEEEEGMSMDELSQPIGKVGFNYEDRLFLCTVIVSNFLEWCIRLLCFSVIISHNITSIAHNHHTNNHHDT